MDSDLIARPWCGRWRVAAVGLAVAVLAGCGGSSDDGRFAAGDGEKSTCMEHQQEKPGTAYTSGADAETAAVLRVFRYYVANGDKGYCDGAAPTDVDVAWANLVVDLGGSADSVAPILDAATAGS